MKYLILLAVTTFLFFMIRHSSQSSKKVTQSSDPQPTDTIETPTRLTPTEFAEKYNSQKGQVKGGTLCFWGHWFGRPHDNFHRIVSVNYDTTKNILTIHFNEEEILTLTNPSKIEESSNKISINSADKIHWQWYYYGKAKEPENLFYYDIFRHDTVVTGSTNADWHKADWGVLTIAKPAVLLT